jgi:hypothetical protein
MTPEEETALRAQVAQLLAENAALREQLRVQVPIRYGSCSFEHHFVNRLTF